MYIADLRMRRVPETLVRDTVVTDVSVHRPEESTGSRGCDGVTGGRTGWDAEVPV